MITEKEYRRAQVLLGAKGKPQPHTREFAFTGLMRCGECASMITAEEKNQIICSGCKNKFAYKNKTACPKCKLEISKMKSPVILNYVYYRCTKKKNSMCSQKYIRLEDLEKQFSKVLGDVKIDEDYLNVALEYLADKQKNAGADEKVARMSLQEVYDNNQTRLKNLNREFTSPQNAKHEIYTAEEFKEQKAEILAERKEIEKGMNTVKEKLDQTLELSERTFIFCTYALHHFNTGDLQKKKEIFSTIGSNLTLLDKKLSIERLHPYMLIENELKDQRALFAPLEPEKRGYKKEKETIFIASLPSWLRG